ncbi:unnamed protein product (macronuclear) [Paramecium tetraurelia]|uniref:Uncharacterized protein n=1 Tax=Paramecium tetraurelia TaxID=5888 RepID=A0CJU2_PARTE|nr:uncharacterized protein GSPATT00000771001 [Paramecium tetraurelia]CAK71059.1 unnamed protein product [Paramecium tetraurelia]|eukprot:XP_001438456.1 hypothetical protein (macronuclear) [Paramecium tetraurelia strain d4-2]
MIIKVEAEVAVSLAKGTINITNPKIRNLKKKEIVTKMIIKNIYLTILVQLDYKKNIILAMNILKSKEEYKILDQNQKINLAPNNQFQIQCENLDLGNRHYTTIPLPQKDLNSNIKESLDKQVYEMITINDSSQEDNRDAGSIGDKTGHHHDIDQVENSKMDSTRNGQLGQKIPKIQKTKIKRESQQQTKQTKQSFDCIDLTKDDTILSFFGLNHPMLQSSLEYNKNELFELVEPYEYQCGNFMISLGIQGHYTAIVTLPSLSQKKAVYYLFMKFQFDQKNVYCMIPEDDQTILLVNSNIQTLYYYCNSNTQQKGNHKTTFQESILKYKFPYIFPTLIRKFVVSYQKNDQQIRYQINYDSHAIQLAIEDYYQDIPGHLITGTSHPILKILFIKTQNNQIPQFYYKFLSVPLYEGQFSLKASLLQNSNLIVVERRFLSPFCYGIHSIKIEVNRITNVIIMKQSGKDQEIQSKNIQQFWDEVHQKYLQLYPSKLLYNYFVELINQDRKVLEKYKKWNQLNEYLSKSQQFKPNKQNEKPIILNNKEFFCFSIEDIKNGNRIKYQ